MPYENEHAARLRDPDDFARIVQLWGDDGKGIRALGGPLKSSPGGKAVEQAIRFNHQKWSVAEAKKWLSEHDYKPILFEEATGGKMTTGSIHKSYGDCEGPLGLPLKSEVARDLEATLESLDADCKALVEQAGGLLRKARIAEVQIEEGERADISLVTTDALDLDGEVMLPDGLDWGPFRKNGGPVTFGHNYQLPPVGRCAWLIRNESPNGWKAKTLYHPRPGPDVLPEHAAWLPDVAYHYVRDLGMHGRSIGYVPTRTRKATPAEISARPELRQAKVIASAKVFEYAITAIPCNQQAVVELVGKAAKAGIPTPEALLDAFGIIIPGLGDSPAGGGSASREDSRDAEVPPTITVAEVKAMVAQRLAALDLGGLVAGTIDKLRGRI